MNSEIEYIEVNKIKIYSEIMNAVSEARNVQLLCIWRKLEGLKVNLTQKTI